MSRYQERIIRRLSPLVTTLQLFEGSLRFVAHALGLELVVAGLPLNQRIDVVLAEALDRLTRPRTLETCRLMNVVARCGVQDRSIPHDRLGSPTLAESAKQARLPATALFIK
jgi:hypothetical protein